MVRQSLLTRTVLNRASYAAASLTLFAVGTLACHDVTAPLPPGATPIEAPRPYALWWQMTEACSGRTGDFSAIHWFVVPNATTFEVRGEQYSGYWFGNNSIVIASRQLLSGQLVRHEMLHALIGRGHSRAFLDACGGVVVCEEECLTEAGGLATLDATAVAAPATALQAELQVEPPNPSLSGDSGWVALSVVIHTPQQANVRATLTPIPGDAFFFATFGYLVLSCRAACTSTTHSYENVTGTLYDITVGATRRRVFDVQLPPGTYVARGIFNVDSTAAATFIVRP
jgi:hypothetical protein